MRGFKAFAFAATASVLLAGSLQAQETGLVKWMGVNGAHSRYSTSSTGAGAQDIYRSPYFAQFKMTGEQSFGPTVDIFCVDFGHYSNTGTYGAFFTNLGSDALNQGITRSTSLNDYLAAAWLASQMVKPTERLDAVTGTRTENQLRIMQAAMWQILSGTPIYWQTVAGAWSGTTSMPIWVGYAREGATRMNPYEWAVVTEGSRNPNGGVTLGAGQEYITQVTPEPATMLLLGTGLVVMLMAAGALRRPVA
jgi:hypothetical protein